MASAVTVVFGANSTQFQAELARMQTMTMAASKRISTQAMGGHIQGMSTLVREGITIPREVLEGRGMGRIIASMSIFASALGMVAGSSHKAATYTQQLADGYERLAQQARLAEIAALKKAEASAADAYAESLEDSATIAAADADAIKAKTATEARIAAELKAEGAIEAANAEEMEAIASGEATASSVPMLAIFIGIVAVLALLYGAYKVVSAVMNSFTQQKIKAAEVARETSLNFQEEAAALDKLAEAAEKSEDALRKLNAVHDDYAKRVDAAVEAQKNLYDHSKKLAELQKEGALTKVDIAEKKGEITHEEAIKKKAAIEKQANLDAAKAQTEQLLNERDMLIIANQRAAAFAQQKQAEAKAASDAINQTPEGKANALELARLEHIEKKTRENADKAMDEAVKMAPGHEKDTQTAYANTLGGIADMAHGQVQEQKGKMKPAEIAAADAMSAATEATQNSKTIAEQHTKAVDAWLNDVKTSSTEVAAKNANIDLKAQDELLGKQRGNATGYSLNSQQKVGAYAATAPILLQQLVELRGIKANTAPHAPPSNHPPGEKKPQFGPKPSGGRSWARGW